MCLGRLARGADDLLVTLVSDKQDVVVLGREPAGLLVYLGDQRTGGVDDVQAARAGVVVHLRRDAVSREHHGGTGRDLLGLVDEDRAALLERLHDMSVVHDLFADVYRTRQPLQRRFHRLNRPVDARAVPARPGQQDTPGRTGQPPCRLCAGPRVGGEHILHCGHRGRVAVGRDDGGHRVDDAGERQAAGEERRDTFLVRGVVTAGAVPPAAPTSRAMTAGKASSSSGRNCQLRADVQSMPVPTPGTRRGQASATAIGSRMSGALACTSMEPSTNSTIEWTMDCG